MAADKYEVKFNVDDSGSLTYEQSIKVGNWQEVKSSYTSSKKCPYYSYVYKNKLYLYYDYDAMLKDATEKKATILNSLSYAEDTGDDSKKETANKVLSELNTQCSSVASTKFDYTKCWDESKITTKYTECKKQASALGSQIRSKISEVNGYVSTGALSKTDAAYTEMEKNCASALTNISDYETALKYSSCEEYKAAMGVDIECSVKKEDVKDDYLPGEKSNTSNDPIQICDPEQNKETLIAFRLVSIFITIIKIIAPIIIIVLGMIDMSKAVTEGKDGAIKSSLMNFLKRAIACILIFFTPSIINVVFDMIDGWDNVKSGFSTCMDCITGSDDCPNVKFDDSYRTGD